MCVFSFSFSFSLSFFDFFRGPPSAEELERQRMNPRHRSLKRISVGSNRLTGPVGVLSVSLKLRLEHLTLPNNRLSGSLDGLFARWQRSSDQRVSLVTLNLSGNALTGRLPRALQTARHALKTLDLGHNRLTGTADPLLLGQLTLLRALRLSHNRLTGAVPEALTNLSSSLVELSMGHNNLSGSLPCEALGMLSELQVGGCAV